MKKAELDFKCAAPDDQQGAHAKFILKWSTFASVLKDTVKDASQAIWLVRHVPTIQ